LATTVVRTVYAPSRAPGRRYDNLFFSGMAVLILFAVFIGFARSYYLAGVFQAPLPNRLVHIHGAVFTCWILLLIAQTALVSAHRVDIHRRLGLVGFGLACTMPILAIYAAVDSLVRHASRPTARAFFVVPTFDILAFAPLIFFAWKYRSNAAAHKRLIIIDDCDSRCGGCALAHPCCVVGSASLGVGDRGFSHTAIRLRSFLDSEDSSGHAVGKRVACFSSARPRADWAEWRLAGVCSLGSARGAVSV
jgi:hypothetical protein